MKNRFFDRVFLITAAISVILIIISFGHIVNFYFWHDDYTSLYKAQNGILFNFPYRFFSTITPILYKFFGLNPKGYFITGIFLYFVCSLLLYKLIMEIFNDKFLAFCGTLLFSSGFLGQGSLIMFEGDGISTLFALPLVLIGLILYIKYFKKGYKFLIFLTYLLVYFVLKIAPQRYLGLSVSLIFIDWFFWFEKGKKISNIKWVLLRNIIFFLIFYFEYNVTKKPFLFNEVFSIQNVFIQVGNFWNFIFPSYITENLLGTILPSLFSYVFLFWIFVFKRKKKVIFVNLIFLILFNVFIYNLSKIYVTDPIVRVETINGFLLFFVIILMTLNKLGNKYIVLSLILVGGLSTFFLASPLFAMDSSYRYLIAYSFVSPIFLLSVFKNKNKVLVFIPIFILIVLKVFSAVTTQISFYNDYEIHFKRIYTALKKEIPNVTNPVLIYIEGTTKELDFVAADVFRVGEFGPEAAIGVNYNLPMSKFKIAGNYEDITVDIPNIYTFIYNGESLVNTSSITRSMLNEPNKYNVKLPINSKVPTPFILFTQKDLIKPAILSQSPLSGSLDIKNLNGEKEKLEIQWDYDTYGALDAVKTFDFEIDPYVRKTIKFKISGSGMYIKEIRLIGKNETSVKGLQIYTLSIEPSPAIIGHK